MSSQTAVRLPALNSLRYYCSAIFSNFAYEVVQGSARALSIKKTRKTIGGLISGGGYNRMNFH